MNHKKILILHAKTGFLKMKVLGSACIRYSGIYYCPPWCPCVCFRSEHCGTTPIKLAGRTTQPTACTSSTDLRLGSSGTDNNVKCHQSCGLIYYGLLILEKGSNPRICSIYSFFCGHYCSVLLLQLSELFHEESVSPPTSPTQNQHFFLHSYDYND